ncbi:MAG: PDR/VanB family oxidoreductase [Rhodomicrobium sp.]
MTARIIMKMRVTATRDEGGGVKTLTLKHPLRDALPEWSAGAHVDLRLPGGKIRQYSLCGDAADRSQYRIAVKLEDSGRGGSKWVHENLHPGVEAHVSAPRCNFRLHPQASRQIFVAGGIGITPFLAMVREAKAQGTPFELFYCSRFAGPPFAEELREVCAERVRFYCSSGLERRRFDPTTDMPKPSSGTHLYCCGPDRLTAAVREATAHWPQDQVHFEAFQPLSDENFVPEPFDVKIASTGRTFRVPASKSALEVLKEAGFVLPSSCELGVCGSCECGYRDGTVIHRDVVLPVSARQDRLMLCVSRARVQVTLDL